MPKPVRFLIGGLSGYVNIIIIKSNVIEINPFQYL